MEIDQACKSVEEKVISWRRDIHQHPELGNREFRTAKLIAEHLTMLGIEVKTGVAHTGVVGLLRGRNPSPVIALRADMDALPVKEALDLPFASKVTTIYDGREVPVMHACGHDAHVAILMGVAEVLSKMREHLSGTVKFIFQPSEDSRPSGEDGGAELMIREGVLDSPKVDAIFGLHVVPLHVGKIGVRAGGIMAAVDNFWITVRGRGTHGGLPWSGVDPIPVSAQIVLGLQTIISRQIDISKAPAVITIGRIRGGEQTNIVASEVEIAGTIRTFEPGDRIDIQRRIERVSIKTAESAGASAEVVFSSGGAPVTYNDPDLTNRMYPILERVAGSGNVLTPPPLPVGEDFSFYQQKIPGLFFLLGVAPKDADLRKVALNHSPYFFIEESGLLLGVKALSHLAFSFK
ncbi:MAG: amidohydrolase [Candidatus Bathyarchaeia archaeon]